MGHLRPRPEGRQQECPDRRDVRRGRRAVRHLRGLRGVELVADVDADIVRDWLLAVKEAGNSDGTRFDRCNGLKAVLRWAVTEGLLEASPMARVPPPKPQQHPVPVLSGDQLRALLRACAVRDFEAVRDTALVRLLLDTGMRRAESAGLRGRLHAAPTQPALPPGG